MLVFYGIQNISNNDYERDVLQKNIIHFIHAFIAV